MRRRHALPERLDETGHPPEVLEESLEQVDQVNRWLGGLRGLETALRDLVQETGALRVLDVGTGNGGTLRRLGARVRRRGGRWSAVGLDRHPGILRAARRAGSGRPALVRGDALALPFAPDSFDVAVTTLTLHHFSDPDAVRILAEMARVARRRVVVSDLERSRLSYAGARLLALTVWRKNPLTRHDGPVSVLRSFTPDELLELAREAGLGSPSVRRHFPFRLVLRGSP